MGEPVVTVTGIGADGWAGLSPAAREAVLAAEVILGGPRQLELLPDEVRGERVSWPSPMLPALPGLLAEHAGRELCVLASGDPMVFGVGATLARLTGPERLRVLPHPSSISLACARLGWPVDGLEVVSVVGRPLETLHAALTPGRRILVLSADGSTPAAVAGLLVARGYGESALTVLEQLGGPAERVLTGTAADWPHGETDALNVIAIDCVAAPGTPLLTRTPGLPDDAFESDGQLTKREVRALTVSALNPAPGQLLWDVGAGAGSIAIEWLRSHPSCRAIAVEHRADRVERIERNAAALGVPALRIVPGRAPDVLSGLEPPDAIFVGGGSTTSGVLPACWDALRPGGRLVVNAVTVQGEAVVADWHARIGGDLVRIAISRAAPVGGFTGWRPMMPITQWAITKKS
ncbi:precorrin-6y C5,15-methyltransferase (decarboxylating) subunit CbiE [Amycolatopsis anabasis]|uniref:precorrin-6y C5,15-methyltransferase (decarboxylating) subunit CbiE n=1 Tax=Amycolatopsis anabasis TaxID=1840409 RepID=UPI00131DFCA0|nr:precorrin-6y C5,15-methyltransferase (decarboxylating) subunit CbiE [Amycolatopsis anabasis]